MCSSQSRLNCEQRRQLQRRGVEPETLMDNEHLRQINDNNDTPQTKTQIFQRKGGHYIPGFSRSRKWVRTDTSSVSTSTAKLPTLLADNVCEQGVGSTERMWKRTADLAQDKACTCLRGCLQCLNGRDGSLSHINADSWEKKAHSRHIILMRKGNSPLHSSLHKKAWHANLTFPLIWGGQS